MSSLAEQIIEYKNHDKKADCDEFGIPLKDEYGKSVKDNPQYYVARALLVEQKDPRYDPLTAHRLHTVYGVTYYHDKEVTECSDDFYKLTEVTYNVPKGVQMLFWKYLQLYIPKLDTSIYKICDGLWWDKECGEVVEATDDEILEHWRKVHKDI